MVDEEETLRGSVEAKVNALEARPLISEITHSGRNPAPRPLARLAERIGDTLRDGPFAPDVAAQAAARRVGGRVGGQFELVRLAGVGSAGAVFEARHAPTGVPVAVKLLHEGLNASPELRRRFIREAEIASAIRHPNIISFHAHGEEPDGTLYQVIEFLQGQVLEDALAQGPVYVSELVELGGQLLRGVEAVHQAGYVHRDIKPSNIFLTQAPESPSGVAVKLIDFGIAKVATASDQQAWTTLDGVLLGTPSFMSPEQVHGEHPISSSSDLWCAGAVLFTMLTGRPPHMEARLSDLLRKVASVPAPPVSDFRPDVPPALARVIDRAIRLHPHERWSSAAEMAAALDRVR